MEKLADADYPIHDLLRGRWSPRAFSDRPVEPENLCHLLEAARWAASSYNEQPWSFVLATKGNQNEYDRLLSCLVEGNIQWAQHAPVLMLSVAKLYFDRNKKENRHAFHDVGQAVASLTVQGIALGLFVHQMAGFHVEKARELFHIPQGFEPVAAMALGYPGDPESLPQGLRQAELAPRLRRPLGEFVFAGSWGQVAPLVNGRSN